MNDMVTRVAEAIRDNIQAGLPDGVSVDYRYAALAAIEAMREPTPDVIAEVWRIRGKLEDTDIYRCFITAALKENEEKA